MQIDPCVCFLNVSWICSRYKIHNQTALALAYWVPEDDKRSDTMMRVEDTDKKNSSGIRAEKLYTLLPEESQELKVAELGLVHSTCGLLSCLLTCLLACMAPASHIASKLK